MKISELDFDKLSKEDIYNLIMSGVNDYETQEPTDETKSDIIITLGCSPKPLNARIKKMMALCRKGYSDKILLSGGKGWQKLVERNPERKPEFIEIIRDVIFNEYLGDNPSPIEVKTYNDFNEKMNKLIENRNYNKSYQEQLDEQKFEMTEQEFMNLIILFNGGLKGIKQYHESFSTNTKENCFYVGKIFDNIKRKTGKAIESAMIVTSSFHCTRSKLTFMKNIPNVKFDTCPSTDDIVKTGLDGISPEMMNNEKLSKNIINEAKKIIEYSRKGDIYDAELTDLVNDKIANEIDVKQHQVKIEYEDRCK